jgi:RimJ/RimL family protein N-acetyltransferase
MTVNLASYQSRETLPNGQVIQLRPIQPDDRDQLREEFLKLSEATVRDRFFSIKLDLTPAELTYFTEVDFDHHVALVAELETATAPKPVAVGRLVRMAGQRDHAEIAITVTDAMQGLGIGKIMLLRLSECARELGIRHMDASVLAENTRMMRLLRKSGLGFSTQVDNGIQTISIAL